MLDHNQFHWLNSKEVINCVYAYLWTELAETIDNVKKNTMVLASQNIEKSIQKSTKDIGYMAV